jgi:hypothetical protein
VWSGHSLGAYFDESGLDRTANSAILVLLLIVYPMTTEEILTRFCA